MDIYIWNVNYNQNFGQYVEISFFWWNNNVKHTFLVGDFNSKLESVILITILIPSHLVYELMWKDANENLILAKYLVLLIL